MNKSITSIELACLVKEFQSLIGSKVNKIYILPDKELLIQLHIPGTGRKILRIKSPDFVYLTDYKPQAPEKPHGFCMFLRKYLSNARIREIKQVDFERILEIVFERKEGKYRLFTEFFAPGNIIFTDMDYKIISPLETQEWKDRIIRKNEIYKHPKLKYNFLEIKENELKDLISASDKDSVVKTLAIELGLGGEYAEQLLSRAKLDKNKKQLSDNEVHALFKHIKELRKLKIKPPQPFNSFMEYFDQEFTKRAIKKKDELEQTKANKNMVKSEKIIEAQQGHIIRLEKEAVENQKKGEIIYENYQLINEIITEINKAKSKYSWKEIREKLKGHKVIMEINEKEKEVVVEI